MLYGIQALKVYEKNVNVKPSVYTDPPKSSTEIRTLIYILIGSSIFAVLVLIGLFILFKRIISIKRKKEKILMETEKTLILENLSNPPDYGLMNPPINNSKPKKKKKKRKEEKQMCFS